MNDYDSWKQHALVAEVKARVKAGEIDRSDLDYRRPDNMPMDDLRSALFWNEYVPPPCCCPIHARQRDFAAGKLDTRRRGTTSSSSNSTLISEATCLGIST
jgi:hypothetical protein